MVDAKRATVLVFISHELPEEFETRLRALAQKRAWLNIVKVRSEKALNRQIDLRVAKELESLDYPLCYATVRLDDDDGLATDYLDTLEQYIHSGHDGHCVTFPEGILSVFDGETYSHHYKHRHINNAQGLAFIKALNSADAIETPVTVFSTGNHNNVDKRHPVLMDSRKRMFVRTEHSQSDLVAHGGRERDKDKMVLLDEEEILDFKQRFDFIKFAN